MEKRLVLAIILSILVLIAFQRIFIKPQKLVPPQPAPSAAQPAVQAAPAGAVPEPQKSVPAPSVAPPAAAASKPIEAKEKDTIRIKTDLYTAEWTNQGGVLTSWVLAKYKDSQKKDLDLVPAEAGQNGFLFPFSVRLEDKGVEDRVNGQNYVWTSDPAAVNGEIVIPKDGTAELRFSYFDGTSVRAEKILRFKNGVYPIDIEIRVWKDGVVIPSSLRWGPGLGRLSEKEKKLRESTMGGSTVSGAVLYANGKALRHPEKGYRPEFAAPSSVNWAAYEDHYFTALFVVPDRMSQAAFIKDERGEKTGYYLSFEASSAASPVTKILGYIGPKESSTLIAFGHNTKAVIRYSNFLGINLKPIAELMLVGVRFFYKIIPNWGLAVILLTIVIKILFFPLTYSSTKSMARMAEIQPKIKALQAKYKKSKTDIEQRRQMNEETMKLYKEHGINPAGGCLPMLIQLPVFVAVYQMLSTAIEFRNSPFIPFWINDLSVRDKTYILPILMGGTQFVSQKMTPTSVDSTQAKMMLLMPVIMTGFFLWAQSGLVLYWLTTNVLQIGQQAIINRMMEKAKAARAAKPSKAR